MCLKATVQGAALALAALAAALPAQAQTRTDSATDVSKPGDPALDWRHIGNSAVETGLPSVATGAVSRVWYSADGARLFTQTADGHVFVSTDREQWTASTDAPPPSDTRVQTKTLPEAHAVVRDARDGRLYAFAEQAWRSDNGGAAWTSLTGWNGKSLVGGSIADLAVSPQNSDELSLATATGVWHSTDGGLSWSGLNEFLPALRGRRIGASPFGSHGLTLAVADLGADVEWQPGEKTAWRPAQSALLAQQAQRNGALAAVLKTRISASAESGDFLYAGASDGRLFSSGDRGRTWKPSAANEESGAVEAIYVDPKDPRVSLAVSGAHTASVPGARVVHVRRTVNGGAFWDDLTSNLPDAAVHGVTADRASGAVYVASDAGVFFTIADLNAAGPPTPWTALGHGLPAAPAMDVRLDASGNQLYALLDGYGAYATIAPHRLRDARVVSAADYAVRPAAPGAVMTVLGAHVSIARAADAPAPVLAASDLESQLQIPFDATGSTLPLVLEDGNRTLARTVPLQTTAPAIFTDRDGSPMLLDGDSGILLDASRPARSNTRIQILATGLGRVTPDWPAGAAAPLTDAPRVNVAVHAWLDRQPVDVASATLAPGYIGMYLVEVQLPSIVNAGPAELYIDADGHESNRVRVWIEP